jgi:subtilisin family serine protease
MAIDLGAQIVNMSFGTDDEALEPNAPRPHAETIAYAARRGVVLVAASGNSGDMRTYWPAAFPDVIAVGSVGDDGRPSKFSTRGTHVALSAPGERVLTATIHGYQNATGTSFAAPFVAGAAALLMARAARRSHPLQPAAARAILCASVEPWGGDPGEGMGAGVLNVAAALELLDAELDGEAIGMERDEEDNDD